MKTKGRPKSKNVTDARGPTGAYLSGAIGQRVAKRRETDYVNSISKGSKGSRVKFPKMKGK